MDELDGMAHVVGNLLNTWQYSITQSHLVNSVADDGQYKPDNHDTTTYIHVVF